MTSGIDSAAWVVDNVEWLMTGPDGEVLSQGASHNLVTQVGIQEFVERGAGIAGAGPIAVGMKLGTGSTAASATGAGAALVAYLPGSNLVFDATWPKSSLAVASRRAQFQCTYAAGVATSAVPITEAVLFNDANTNGTSPAGSTISRAIISPGIKDAASSLVVVWNLDFLPS